MSDAFEAAVYGLPPRDVIEPTPGARQVSPVIPGSADLAELDEGVLASVDMLAPPSLVDARVALAHALRALAVGGTLTAAAPKDKGGMRLKKLLQGFGCEVGEISRRHHRICSVERPQTLVDVDAALAEGAPRRLGGDGLWSQPGVFSWDRLDPGSALLMEHLPAFSGRGADFGCGIGWLAQVVLRAPAVTALTLLDVDRRAVECARRNVDDPRVAFAWADVRQAELSDVDFVVSNPPFHEAGAEDKGLGQAFIRAAAQALRTGGSLWIVANRHLPYEAELSTAFKRVRPVADRGGYKVYEAVK